MKHGKLRQIEDDLKSCPTVMLRVPISGASGKASGSSHDSNNGKKEQKMPRRIIATVHPLRSSSGSKSPLRNSDCESVSRYSVLSSRPQRRSDRTVASEGASTVRSRMSIRRGGSCLGYHVPGHIVLGVVIFSVLTLWHHSNYFTPDSYLSPYISAMRDVTAETAQSLYHPPFDNSNQAILQAMDLKSMSDAAEPQGMKVPHPNAVEMKEFLRRAQSATQKDMIRMDMLGESSASDKGSTDRKPQSQEQRSLQDNATENEEEKESGAKQEEPISKKKRQKQPQSDEKASSDGNDKKTSSRKQETQENEKQDSRKSMESTESKPRKNLRSSKFVADDNDQALPKEDDEKEKVSTSNKHDESNEDEPKPVHIVSRKQETQVDEEQDSKTPTESTESKSRKSMRSSKSSAADDNDQAVVPKQDDEKEKDSTKRDESNEDESIAAHEVSDDPCSTMVTTIDPVKGIMQKKIPLISCQKKKRLLRTK